MAHLNGRLRRFKLPRLIHFVFRAIAENRHREDQENGFAQAILARELEKRREGIDEAFVGPGFQPAAAFSGGVVRQTSNGIGAEPDDNRGKAKHENAFASCSRLLHTRSLGSVRGTAVIIGDSASISPSPEIAVSPDNSRIGEVVVGRRAGQLEQLVERRRVERPAGQTPCACAACVSPARPHHRDNGRRSSRQALRGVCSARAAAPRPVRAGGGAAGESRNSRRPRLLEDPT